MRCGGGEVVVAAWFSDGVGACLAGVCDTCWAVQQ